ncbi:hypothetical protein GCM10023173_18920 [Sphingobacterium thermophilum]|uniref:Uncharacterized protein n=1 Tax=Sphingobacterium thermophilum TaxID=768534 RepID=A0ABP8R4D8_9SPHI
MGAQKSSQKCGDFFVYKRHLFKYLTLSIKIEPANILIIEAIRAKIILVVEQFSVIVNSTSISSDI